MAEAQTTERPLSNSDVNWDCFNSKEYVDHNYQSVRDDDREIVRRVRDFFGQAGVTGGRGVDVGPGANLYPSLGMLPFCTTLDLREYSASNVAWLSEQKPGYAPNWDQFWDVYREHPAYAAVTDPRARFREIVTVEQASVFNLPTASWDLGTMFFVACSLSSKMSEFTDAVHRFVQALVPGAPFATAFMARSKGYRVGERWFPAVAIGPEDVRDAFSSVAQQVSVVEIEAGQTLRDDVGMIVATGHAKH